MTPSDIDLRIVLVRPRNPLNIGAAARAMLNFGFEDLAVVSTYEPTWRESKSAVGAVEVLRKARAVPKLIDAIDDRTLVIGTSSMARRELAQPLFSLDQFSKSISKRRIKASGGRLALIFGSEKTGLSNQDLSHCHWIARIPTIPGCPSMNLGQAVAVCCYELRRQFGENPGARAELFGKNEAPANAKEVDRLLTEIENLLKRTTVRSPVHTARLRQTLLRLPMSSADVTVALRVLRDLSEEPQQES